MKIQRVPDPSRDTRFLELSGRVRRGDPQAIEEGLRSMRKRLRDPGYREHQMGFLAVRGSVAVARCVARHRANEPRAGSIGFFESEAALCRPLLDAACKWLHEQGVRRVLGPMDGDTWHAYRFNTGPYDAAPFLKEPWNPPGYPALWEAAGFRVVDRYYSARVPDAARAAEALSPYLRRVRRQGYVFRPFRLNKMEAELDLLYALSLRIFSDNDHYSPISREGFRLLYQGARSLIHPALCQFCHNAAGDPVGFFFAFPDYAEAVRAMKGRWTPPALWRFMRARSKAARVCIKTLGCIPECRGTGVGPALMGLAYEATVAAGYNEALMCLMHESNDSRRLDGGASTPFRTYALYARDLSQAGAGR